MNETGAPLFCLKDVCTALALDSKQVVRRLDKEVVSKHPLLTEGGKQMATFINEDGLYDVILDSRKAEARAFRKWVTSEVLPQIRMTVFDFNAVLQGIGIQYRSRGRWPPFPKVATPEWARSPTHASACAS